MRIEVDLHGYLMSLNVVSGWYISRLKDDYLSQDLILHTQGYLTRSHLLYQLQGIENQNVQHVKIHIILYIIIFV